MSNEMPGVALARLLGIPFSQEVNGMTWDLMGYQITASPGQHIKLQILAQYEGWDNDTASMNMLTHEYELVLKDPPKNGIDIGLPTIRQDDSTNRKSD